MTSRDTCLFSCEITCCVVVWQINAPLTSPLRAVFLLCSCLELHSHCKFSIFTPDCWAFSCFTILADLQCGDVSMSFCCFSSPGSNFFTLFTQTTLNEAIPVLPINHLDLCHRHVAESMFACHTFILMSRPCFSSSFLISWAPSLAAFRTKCFHSIGWKTWGSWGTYRPIFTWDKQRTRLNTPLLMPRTLLPFLPPSSPLTFFSVCWYLL